MISKLINIFILNTFLFASGGYDHGSSAGKGKWDISLTLNLFNYFEYGQSYAIIGYGLTNKIDLQLYYSHSHKGNGNYYTGLLYQFYDSQRIDLSTAIGIRKYTNQNNTHLFAPQLLYTLKLTDNFKIGGSFVMLNDINEDQKQLGLAKDIFFMLNIFENEKYKLEITAGSFSPILWKPEKGDWYPTYSIDIKIK